MKAIRQVGLYIGLGILLGMFIMASALVLYRGPGQLPSSEPSARRTGQEPPSPSITVVPTPPATVPLSSPAVSLSFTEICAIGATMTGLLQKSFIDSLTHEQVIGWTGTVYAIHPAEAGYTVQLDMRAGPARARQLEIVGVSAEVAGRLTVGQMIRFAGTIQAITVASGLICNPLIIEDATITPL
jgi:hypothetical protein